MNRSIFLVTALLISCISISQEDPAHKLEYGFYLELNRTFLDAPDGKAKDALLAPAFGGGLGISMEYKPTTHVSLVTAAGLSYGDAAVDFVSGGEITETYEVYPVNLDFRLHGKYAFGKKASKPYILFGPSVMVPLGNLKEATNEFTNRTAVSLDFGIGFDKELEHFRFAPEIRYAYGLNDINSFPVLSSLYAHRLTLTFHFRG